ncbi:MAG: nuclear transport factor 2 family protein [Janthinobacterium lividum]
MATLEERIQKLEDEAAIRDLAATFADAATRNDMALLASVWTKEGIFTIEAPLKNVCSGVEEIVTLISKLRGDKEFFVQFVHSGVMDVKGDHATARWIMREVGKGGDKYYHNYGMFSDAMEKVDGKWLFTERTWHFAYLDFSPFTGTGYALPSSVTAH